MVNVPSEWMRKQQDNLRKAISDLEEHQRSLPVDDQEKLSHIIDRLKDTLNGDEAYAGTWS
jgi:hypothetical protein